MTGTGLHVYLHTYEILLQSTVMKAATFHRDYFPIKGEQGELLQG